MNTLLVVNPFVALYDHPVETLTAAAYALVLVALLVGTWYATTRNALTLYQTYQNGWQVLPPFGWALRAMAVPLTLAIDCLLIAGVVYVLT